MEPIRSLANVSGSLSVNERQAGGGKRQADAFRQAMQQSGEQSGKPATGPLQRSMRSALQVPAPDSRRDGETRHVDVIA